jgi:hypothetical protein
MRPTPIPLSHAIALALGACLTHAPALAQEDAEATLVDFRMAPLEQAKKIFQLVRQDGRSGVTLTLMNRLVPGADGLHVIVGEDQATPEYLQAALSEAGVDSVTWTPRSDKELYGTCDSDSDCEAKVDSMCKKAGHGGVKEKTVKVTLHSDGSKTCSASCKDNGAVAFVTCDPNRG